MALALLNEHFDRSWLQKMDPSVREEELSKSWDRLDIARELAGGLLSNRVAAWEPPMILGTTTMLDAARRGGVARLLATRPTWERELRAAAERAPGKAEPLRFLTGAYLGVWTSLPDEEQRRLEPLIARALSNRQTFTLLGEAWVRVAADRSRAWSAVPDRSWAWRNLQSIYRNEDWSLFVETWNRWDHALLAELERELEESSRHPGRDPRQARSALLSIAARARPDRRYAAVLSGALEVCPPGTAVPYWVERLSATLDWTLEECLRSTCPVSPKALERLAGAIGELPPHKRAVVALLSGDESRASFLEHQFSAPGAEAWAPYLLQKARVLAERGAAPQALILLGGLHRSWRGTPLEVDLRRRLAEQAADSGAADDARREMETLAVSKWSATDWRWSGDKATLELATAESASGVSIDIDVAPRNGEPIELRCDGVAEAIAVAHEGEPVTLRVPLSPGIHFLEMTPLSGGGVAPGKTRVLP
jgi:hypothetical protein